MSTSRFPLAPSLIAFVNRSQQVRGGRPLGETVDVLFATGAENAPRTPSLEHSAYRAWRYLVWYGRARVCACRGIFGPGLHQLWDDGVGTCRRIKDELIPLLKAEGKTWRGVVDEAVQTLSWKRPEPQWPISVEPGEAEELKVLLDRLAEKTER